MALDDKERSERFEQIIATRQFGNAAVAKRPLEIEEEETTTPKNKKARVDQVLPYFFVAPLEIAANGLACVKWLPSSTPERVVIEEAIHHAIDLQCKDYNEEERNVPDCFIGTLLCAIGMLQTKKAEEPQNGKLVKLCHRHWPQLFTVKDFGQWEWDSDGHNNGRDQFFLTAHVVLYFAEDPF